LKQQVLLECTHPGASVAQVAMAHGINANIELAQAGTRDEAAIACRAVRTRIRSAY
jgi:transposase-like protein